MKLQERMPIWVWALIIGLLITATILACIHIFGIYNLSFLGGAFLGFYIWAGSDVLNGVITLVGAAFLFGLIGYYIKGYKGIKTNQPIYNPQGQTVSAPAQQQSETVVSS
jgi:hypothetical protein